MESLDGTTGLRPCSAIRFLAANGAKPPFPLCWQLVHAKSRGCIDDSPVPSPAPLQDAAWDAAQRRDGTTPGCRRDPNLAISA